MNDLLIELGTEELPSKAVRPLMEALAQQFTLQLQQHDIPYNEVQSFGSPRRIALYIKEVACSKPSQAIQKKGPMVANSLDDKGQPTPALQGFLRSCGVTLDKLTKLKTDKGEWWQYDAMQEGLPTVELLPQLLTEAVAKLPNFKPMRWGEGVESFVRPLHWLVFLYQNKVVDATLKGIKAGRLSYGHRFHHPSAIEIQEANTYASKLAQGFVLADFNARQATIVQQIQSITKEGMVAVISPTLLEEVTSIVEWPCALLATFDEAFLEVPKEALIAAMEVHQKYFPITNQSGQLLPYFVLVANIDSHNPTQVVKGNERVMRARLSDAAFFYQQDKKTPLSAHQEKLKDLLFQAKLGSMQDKIDRMQQLMGHFIAPLTLDKAMAEQAVALCKCDLLTGMVGEFPELQGIMGYYYALHDEEVPSVAMAIKEQYYPRFANDRLPETSLGLALSLVDRLDLLVGNFAINQMPTGMKDPYKLRRNALAVARLLIASNTYLSLQALINDCVSTYQPSLPIAAASVELLKPFILDRLTALYQSQGIKEDVVMAVRSTQDDCLYDMNQRIEALHTFVTAHDVLRLVGSLKRVNHLLQRTPAEKDALINTEIQQEPAEIALYQKMIQLQASLAPLYEARDYLTIFQQLTQLAPLIDDFFAQVMVMVEDKAQRENRLQLLHHLRQMMQSVADLTLLYPKEVATV